MSPGAWLGDDLKPPTRELGTFPHGSIDLMSLREPLTLPVMDH